MNNKILIKCLEILSHNPVEAVDISYVRGMLETLIAMNPSEATPQEVKKILGVPDLSNRVNVPGVPSIGNLEEIKRMAGEQT